jgi:hypothetical protein
MGFWGGKIVVSASRFFQVNLLIDCFDFHFFLLGCKERI